MLYVYNFRHGILNKCERILENTRKHTIYKHIRRNSQVRTEIYTRTRQREKRRREKGKKKKKKEKEASFSRQSRRRH